MATTYDEMVNKVLMWANRDPDVFGAATNRMVATNGTVTNPFTKASSGEIVSFLQYAADKCYRKLRVPPLEFTRTFDIDAADITTETHNNNLFEVSMPVPDDLIEVLHIRNVTRGYVFNEKVDMRTYYDKYADKKEACYWTREGNEFLITGFLAADEVLELHYYRRLPALDAKYLVTAATFNRLLESTMDDYTAAFTTTNNGGPNGILYFPTGSTVTDLASITFPSEITLSYEVDSMTTIDRQFDFPEEGKIAADLNTYTATYSVLDHLIEDDTDSDLVTFTGTITYTQPSVTIYGIETDHWLREENEKIVLFGALAEAFAYLGEDDQWQKYNGLFEQEIQQLNSEEAMRMGAGANIRINYNGYGQI